MKKTTQPGNLFDSSQFGYLQVVTTTGEKHLFIAGQVGWDKSGEVVSDDLVAQARQALQNVKLATEAPGSRAAQQQFQREQIRRIQNAVASGRVQVGALEL